MHQWHDNNSQESTQRRYWEGGNSYSQSRPQRQGKGKGESSQKRSHRVIAFWWRQQHRSQWWGWERSRAEFGDCSSTKSSTCTIHEVQPFHEVQTCPVYIHFMRMQGTQTKSIFILWGCRVPKLNTSLYDLSIIGLGTWLLWSQNNHHWHLSR